MTKVSATCPLQDGFSPVYDNMDDAVADLEVRGISPDVFHEEDSDKRFDGLISCDPLQIRSFTATQDSLSWLVAQMPTSRIADKLDDLYNQAYAYDPESGLMDIADIHAKRQLDLWIGVIEHRAHDDEEFLNRVLFLPESLSGPQCDLQNPNSNESDRREIAAILSLNSPYLLPEDRGAFYRLKNGEDSFGEFASGQLQASHDWLTSYDGKTDWLKTPYCKSQLDLQNALVAWIGSDELQMQFKTAFSHGEVADVANRAGLGGDYRRVSGESDENLLARYEDLFGLLSEASPAAQKKVVQELMLISDVLAERGRDVHWDLKESFIKYLTTQVGFSIEDAELLAGEGSPQYSASRLDDYQARFQYLAKFREIYEDFIAASPQARFASPNSGRYVIWGEFLLNQAITGAPIRLKDIEEIRDQVRANHPLKMDRFGSWDHFIHRDPAKAYLFDPREVFPGPLDWFSLDPLVAANFVQVDARSIPQYVSDQVDAIAVLPPEMVPVQHAAGMAYMLFGVMVLNGQEWDPRRVTIPLSPGYFLEVASHEAAHHDWARTVLDRDPQRLRWQAANERFAFLAGQRITDQYLKGFADPGEKNFLVRLQTQTGRFLAATNERLGLPADDVSADPLDPRWADKPSSFFSFYPSNLVDASGKSAPSWEEQIKNMTETKRNELWQKLVKGDTQRHHWSSTDRRALDETLKQLDRLGDGDLSETYRTGPFLTLFNDLRRYYPPLTHVTLNGQSWRAWKSRILAMAQYQKAQEVYLTKATSRVGLILDREIRLLGKGEQDEARKALADLDNVKGGSPVFLGQDHPLLRIINRLYAEGGWNPVSALSFKSPSQWEAVEKHLYDIDLEKSYRLR